MKLKQTKQSTDFYHNFNHIFAGMGQYCIDTAHTPCSLQAQPSSLQFLEILAQPPVRSLAGAHKSDMVQDSHKQRVLQSEVKVGYIASFQQTRPEHLGKQLRFQMEENWDFACCTSGAIWDAGITWTRQPALVFVIL